MAESRKGFNRRDFLKIVGAGTGMAATGCAQELPERLIPYVVQPDEVVPGVASWYAGSCGECSAGCGVLVRTREGRAVKVEGNPAHPLSKGGLCAIGQSSVQGLYDPDRLREPLMRDVNGSFKPVSWREAIAAVAEAIAASSGAGKETALLTAPLDGSSATIVREFVANVAGATHTEYHSQEDVIQQAAAEHVYGPGSRVRYDFSLPDVIVSFGAGFLETWGSPVENMKGFASKRVPDRNGKVSRFFHIEPRLSLTAANADTWLLNTPGSEHHILAALLKVLVDKRGGNAEAARAVQGVSVEQELKGTGVSRSDLDSIARSLLGAQTSVVLAGGSAVQSGQGIRAAILAQLINSVLNNVGTSVLVYRAGENRQRASLEPLRALIQRMSNEEKNVGVLFMAGINPRYTLPVETGFAKAIANAATVVSLSTHLDESSRFANIVLPLSTSFEAWGDSEPAPGVFNLSQPAMQPLYKTQSLGDTLVALAASEQINKPFGDVVSFQDYIQRQWEARTGSGNFEKRWIQYVQAGGDWSGRRDLRGSTAPVSGAGNLPVVETELPSKGLALLAFPTTRFGEDGRSANRPWMQEIPDPLSTVVWGSWVEMHPDTAAAMRFEQGQMVQVIGPHGSFDAPVNITRHIHPSLMAVPLGQGHEALGRYAAGVGANVTALAPVSKSDFLAQRLFAGVEVRRSLAEEEMVQLQAHDSQKGRGIVREVSMAALAGQGAKKHDAHADPHHAVPENFHMPPHHDPDELGPHEQPLQMYKQMEHVQYRWGMSIDVSKCTGCSACVVACYAENNVPVVGKELCGEGREMSWIRIERYLDGPETRPVTAFQPMLCQHCNNAPCEPVCPVYATYHSDEGLNTMVYNRCVGTRYCSNNCSYKVRRFNWFDYEWPEPLNWQLNPDVTVRNVGVMEKCTFCIQRIREGQNRAKDLGRPVKDGEVVPACASSCPADAIKFGDLNDGSSRVAEDHRDARSYKVLDAHLNTQPAIAYLARVVNEDSETKAG